MKKLILTLLLAAWLSSPCWADSTLKFMWAPNQEGDLKGYRLYKSSISGKYTFGADKAIATILKDTQTIMIKHVPDGKWWYVLTAFDRTGNESLPSNEVTVYLNTIAPKRPTLLKLQSWQTDLEVK